eukprot:Opistho-1_new@22339
MDRRHRGVTCDGCAETDFAGARYRCVVCDSYDLCHSCHVAGVTTRQHAESHPMEQVPVRRARDARLLCPFCDTGGLSEDAFVAHVIQAHSDVSQAPMVCPICAGHAGYQGASCTETTFFEHLWLTHQCRSPLLESSTPKARLAAPLCESLRTPLAPSHSTVDAPVPAGRLRSTFVQELVYAMLLGDDGL